MSASGPDSASRAGTAVFILEAFGFCTNSCISEGPLLYIDNPISQGPVLAAHWMAETFIALPRPDLCAVVREIWSHPPEYRSDSVAGLVHLGRSGCHYGWEALGVCGGRAVGRWSPGHTGAVILGTRQGQSTTDVYTCWPAMQQPELAMSLGRRLLRKHCAWCKGEMLQRITGYRGKGIEGYIYIWETIYL